MLTRNAPPNRSHAQKNKVKSAISASFRAVLALILREASTRYGRTPGGYIWAVAEPLAAILVLSAGLSLIVRTPSLGTSFLLFYATGFLPFNLAMQVANATAGSLRFSRPLLQYPVVTWLDAMLARFLLNSLSCLLVFVLLTGGILLASGSPAMPDAPVAVAALALAMLFGFGLGALNCTLLGLFPAWEVAWSVITRPLFLASGVLFIFEDLPQQAQAVLWYNPLLHITGIARSGFYPDYPSAYASPVYVLLISLALLALGLVLTRRYHREILTG